jgi:hypothetical protein
MDPDAFKTAMDKLVTQAPVPDPSNLTAETARTQPCPPALKEGLMRDLATAFWAHVPASDQKSYGRSKFWHPFVAQTKLTPWYRYCEQNKVAYQVSLDLWYKSFTTVLDARLRRKDKVVAPSVPQAPQYAIPVSSEPAVSVVRPAKFKELKNRVADLTSLVAAVSGRLDVLERELAKSRKLQSAVVVPAARQEASRSRKMSKASKALTVSGASKAPCAVIYSRLQSITVNFSRLQSITVDYSQTLGVLKTSMAGSWAIPISAHNRGQSTLQACERQGGWLGHRLQRKFLCAAP